MKSLSSQSSEYKELIETNQAQLEQVESEIRAAIASASRGSGSISGSTGNVQVSLVIRRIREEYRQVILTIHRADTTAVLISR